MPDRKVKTFVAAGWAVLLLALSGLSTATPTARADATTPAPPASSRLIALTFDDGPDTILTPRILDTLAREHVRATFFVIGTSVLAHPEITRRIVRDGHALGNHSYDHARLTRLSHEQILWELRAADQSLYLYSGCRPRWFRPPYGRLSPLAQRQVRQLGYTVVGWSVDSRDWEGISAAQITRNVLRSLAPGAVILLHSGGSNPSTRMHTAAALPAIIIAARQMGYTFATLDQVLGSSRPLGLQPSPQSGCR